MEELIWFYTVILGNLIVGLVTYAASRRDFKKRQAEYEKQHAEEVERVRKKFEL